MSWLETQIKNANLRWVVREVPAQEQGHCCAKPPLEAGGVLGECVLILVDNLVGGHIDWTISVFAVVDLLRLRADRGMEAFGPPMSGRLVLVAPSVRSVDLDPPGWRLGHCYCCCPPCEVFALLFWQRKPLVQQWIVALVDEPIDVEISIPWSGWGLARASRTLTNVLRVPVPFANACYSLGEMLAVVPQGGVQKASCKLGSAVCIASHRFAQIDVQAPHGDPLFEVVEEFPRAES